MEALVISGVVTAGKGFLAHMIYDSYDLIKETTFQDHPRLNKILCELDLQADLQVIESLLEKIKEEHFDGIEKPDKMKNKNPISVCVKNVSEMVNLIKAELNNIKLGIKEHESKWFSNWRTVNYETNIKKLVGYKKTLDQRRDMLIAILQLNSQY